MQETLRPQPLETLIDAPPHVLGLARIRGHMLPVLDLAGLLGMPSVPPKRFITLSYDGRGAALAVGEVLGLHELPAAEPLPPLLRETANEPVQALARLDAELLLVLDSVRLFAELPQQTENPT